MFFCGSAKNKTYKTYTTYRKLGVWTGEAGGCRELCQTGRTRRTGLTIAGKTAWGENRDFPRTEYGGNGGNGEYGERALHGLAREAEGNMKYEIGNGKWEMGNGKWEMGNGKWEMGKHGILRHESGFRGACCGGAIRRSRVRQVSLVRQVRKPRRPPGKTGESRFPVLLFTKSGL